MSRISDDWHGYCNTLINYQLYSPSYYPRGYAVMGHFSDQQIGLSDWPAYDNMDSGIVTYATCDCPECSGLPEYIPEPHDLLDDGGWSDQEPEVYEIPEMLYGVSFY